MSGTTLLQVTDRLCRSGWLLLANKDRKQTQTSGFLGIMPMFGSSVTENNTYMYYKTESRIPLSPERKEMTSLKSRTIKVGIKKGMAR